MMTAITSVLDSLAATITAAGVRATIDPRDLNPPCAWVTLNTASRTLGTWDVSADVVLIAPDTGTRAAMTVLDTMLAALSPVLALSQATPETVTLPTSGVPLPALRLTIDT